MKEHLLCHWCPCPFNFKFAKRQRTKHVITCQQGSKIWRMLYAAPPRLCLFRGPCTVDSVKLAVCSRSTLIKWTVSLTFWEKLAMQCQHSTDKDLAWLWSSVQRLLVSNLKVWLRLGPPLDFDSCDHCDWLWQCQSKWTLTTDNQWYQEKITLADFDLCDCDKCNCNHKIMSNSWGGSRDSSRSVAIAWLMEIHAKQNGHSLKTNDTCDCLCDHDCDYECDHRLWPLEKMHGQILPIAHAAWPLPGGGSEPDSVSRKNALGKSSKSEVSKWHWQWQWLRKDNVDDMSQSIYTKNNFPACSSVPNLSTGGAAVISWS